MEFEHGYDSNSHPRCPDLRGSRTVFLRTPKRKRGLVCRTAARRAPHELSFRGASRSFAGPHRLRLVALSGKAAAARALAQRRGSGAPGGAGDGVPGRLDDLGTGRAFLLVARPNAQPVPGCLVRTLFVSQLTFV